MDLQLTGKRALISGSTAGIGYAIANKLAGEGAEVVINGRSQARVDAAVERLRQRHAGARIDGVAADLGGLQGVRTVTDRVRAVDVLVNNMGIFEPKAFEEISDDEWLRFFETNVMSGVRLTRHYLSGMKARNWGRVVFISSESGVHIPAEMIHYGVTKAAQLALSRGVAETTVGSNVTVNAVLPGPTRSEGVSEFLGRLAEEQGATRAQLEQEFIERHRPTSLIHRLATPDEVANLVVYVCSPLSSATNGAALRVDGGVVRTLV